MACDFLLMATALLLESSPALSTSTSETTAQWRAAHDGRHFPSCRKIIQTRRIPGIASRRAASWASMNRNRYMTLLRYFCSADVNVEGCRCAAEAKKKERYARLKERSDRCLGHG